MFRARRFASALTAALPVAAALLVVQFSAANARAGSCEDDVALLPSPFAPWTGAPLRILIVTEKPSEGEFSLIAPNGTVAAKSQERHGGPPYFWFAEVASPAAGTWHATLRRSSAECGTVTRDIVVSAQKQPSPASAPGSVWPVRNAWNHTTENLYSAWVAKLFDAPPDVELSWKAWHEVLRDKSRNMLFDYLGLGEDNVSLSLRPDCADFVYFLRAYFAFKMGLPFGYSNCSRGMGGKPPKCNQWFDIMHPDATRPPPPEQDASVNPLIANSPKPKQKPTFGSYLRDVGDVVHTGSVRVAANDDNTDFYMIPLTQDTLRPGTVYADPYGHVLVLVQRVPEVNGKPGVYLAVDAEPDGSITRKRFWRGNFLFVHEPALGSPGFKHFRQIVSDKSGGLRRLTNAEIAKDPQYGDFSLEQSQFTAEEFYDRMDDVMSPQPLDPVGAMEDAIASLEEQVKTRVTSIENGRKWQATARGDATMPDGPAIFETNGPWEDFSTPARDFRLLIAIDVVRGYPDHVARRADRYSIPFGKGVAGVKAELESVLASDLSSRKFSYTRSDGSQWTLSLKDVVDRAPALEMAYNPNDCVELRWGAAEGSNEASTCKRHAPAAQRAKMTGYRTWFHERHWPTHAGA